MGMFDSFYLKTKCPRCGIEKVREIQTKRFDCLLDKWKQGDEFYTRKIDFADAVIKCLEVWCESDKCRINEPNFNRHTTFYCDVVIKDKKVIEAKNERISRAL